MFTFPLEPAELLEERGMHAAWVVEGAWHCAADRLSRVVPAATGWLTARLHGDARRHRLGEAALRLPLRPLLSEAARQ